MSAVIYITIVLFFKWPTHWYGTFYIYYISVFIHNYRRLNEYIIDNYHIFLVCSIVGFIISYTLYLQADKDLMRIITEIIASLSICFALISGSVILQTRKNRIADVICAVSLEIYLYHVLIVLFVDRYINNEYAGIIIAIIGATCFGYLMNKVDKGIIKITRAMI